MKFLSINFRVLLIRAESSVKITYNKDYFVQYPGKISNKNTYWNNISLFELQSQFYKHN